LKNSNENDIQKNDCYVSGIKSKKIDFYNLLTYHPAQKGTPPMEGNFNTIKIIDYAGAF